ncbi:MAG: GspH/FimT family pseudopilin [Rhodoferax sp.]
MNTCHFHCRSERGITLVEAMVTVSILVILMMMAVPAYKSMIEGNRRSTYVTQLFEDLTLARSEAIKRNARVVVCPSSDGTSCLSALSNDWSTGWLVFVDRDSDNTVSDGDSVVRQHEALVLPAGWIAVDNISVGPHLASFRPTGMIQTNFRICIMESTNTCGSGNGSFSNVVGTTTGRLRIESQ